MDGHAAANLEDLVTVDAEARNVAERMLARA
jgi:hypothetical protein